jgi:predicted exporter
MGPITALAGVALSTLLTAAPLAAQSSGRCDRACLEQLLDRYVDALVARDPSRVPAAHTVTFTENGQRLELGDGLWHTVTGKGGYALPLRRAGIGRCRAAL